MFGIRVRGMQKPWGHEVDMVGMRCRNKGWGSWLWGAWDFMCVSGGDWEKGVGGGLCRG
jgi:hypothetical protein